MAHPGVIDGHPGFNGDPTTDVDVHLGIRVAHSEVVQAHRGAVETLPRVIQDHFEVIPPYFVCAHSWNKKILPVPASETTV